MEKEKNKILKMINLMKTNADTGNKFNEVTLIV